MVLNSRQHEPIPGGQLASSLSLFSHCRSVLKAAAAESSLPSSPLCSRTRATRSPSLSPLLPLPPGSGAAPAFPCHGRRSVELRLGSSPSPPLSSNCCARVFPGSSLTRSPSTAGTSPESTKNVAAAVGFSPTLPTRPPLPALPVA